MLRSQYSSATIWKSGHVGISQTVSVNPFTRTPDPRQSLKLQPLDLPLVANVGARGRLTLPKAAREHLSLSEGDQVLLVMGRHSLELVPADLVSRDELWSLTGPIRSRIESAEDDVQAGRTDTLTDPGSLRKAVRRFLDDRR
jgi:AbrB family looped-hinge helix DNA binding protein